MEDVQDGQDSAIRGFIKGVLAGITGAGHAHTKYTVPVFGDGTVSKARVAYIAS